MASSKKGYNYIPAGVSGIEGGRIAPSPSAGKHWLWPVTAVVVACVLLLVLATYGQQIRIDETLQQIEPPPDRLWGIGVSLAEKSWLFDWAGRYVLRDFDLAAPMANFLPGLGGYWGMKRISREIYLKLIFVCSFRYSNVGLLRESGPSDVQLWNWQQRWFYCYVQYC